MDQEGKKENIIIGIGEYKLAGSADALITFSLGSCVAVILYDQAGKRGGMAHAMLPDSANFAPPHTAKFVDVAIDMMLGEMRVRGCTGSLQGFLIGGANMFPTLFKSESIAAIGERNAESARLILKEKKIQLLAEDTGKDYGRTVEFTPATGEILIKTIKHGIKKLHPR